MTALRSRMLALRSASPASFQALATLTALIALTALRTLSGAAPGG